MNNDPKNSIKQFLKKKIEINERPPEYTKEFIQKKLIEEPKDYYQAQQSFWNRYKTRIRNLPLKFFFWKQRGFKRFMNETFPMLSFITFSCYVVYLMESKFATMKDKVVASKSMKQLQIEEEDEEIKQALFGEGDSKIKKTFPNENKKKQKYKFEFDDEEADAENDIEFTTQDDLLERIYLDSLKGEKVPPQYVGLLNNYLKKRKEKTN